MKKTKNTKEIKKVLNINTPVRSSTTRETIYIEDMCQTKVRYAHRAMDVLRLFQQNQRTISSPDSKSGNFNT